MDQISKDAEIIYNYHRLSSNPTLTPSDAIFCLCSLDTRVASRAANLYLDGLAPILIFSGGSGKLTAARFSAPEADVFAAIAIAKGVPPSAIITESNSTNTGENVRFTFKLLEDRHIRLRKVILVQKPYMERRTFATFSKQWPDPTVSFDVTSPMLGFWEYFDDENPREFIISVMVGDLVRIKEYPALGFQIEQKIPEEVWAAKERLITAGYDKHLS